MFVMHQSIPTVLVAPPPTPFPDQPISMSMSIEYSLKIPKGFVTNTINPPVRISPSPPHLQA